MLVPVRLSLLILIGLFRSDWLIGQNSSEPEVDSFEFYFTDLDFTVLVQPVVSRELNLTQGQQTHIKNLLKESNRLFMAYHEHESYDAIAKQYGIEAGPATVKKLGELDRLTRLELVAGLRKTLFEAQWIRAKQIILQTKLYSAEPLKIYLNSKLSNYLNLKGDEKESVRNAVVSNQTSYYQESVELQKEYQKRVRSTLAPALADKIGESIGDPVIVPRKYNHQTYEVMAAPADFKESMSRGFADRVGVRVSEILADRWLGIELALSDSQIKDIMDLNRETAKLLQENSYYKTYDEVQQEVSEETGILVKSGFGPIALERHHKLLSKIYNGYYSKLDEVLLPEQIRRLKQMLLQIGLNSPSPFGIFLNKDFIRIMKISSADQARLKRAVAEELPGYLNKEKKLNAKYHNKIRQAFAMENRQKLEELMGEPFGYLRPYR